MGENFVEKKDAAVAPHENPVEQFAKHLDALKKSVVAQQSSEKVDYLVLAPKVSALKESITLSQKRELADLRTDVLKSKATPENIISEKTVEEKSSHQFVAQMMDISQWKEQAHRAPDVKNEIAFSAASLVQDVATPKASDSWFANMVRSGVNSLLS